MGEETANVEETSVTKKSIIFRISSGSETDLSCTVDDRCDIDQDCRGTKCRQKEIP